MRVRAGRGGCAGPRGARLLPGLPRARPARAGVPFVPAGRWEVRQAGLRQNQLVIVTKSKTAKERGLGPLHWPGWDSALHCVYGLTPNSWSPRDRVGSPRSLVAVASPGGGGSVLGYPRRALFGYSNAASRRGWRPGPGPTPRGGAGPRGSAARQPPPASAPVAPRLRPLFPLSANTRGRSPVPGRAARPSVLPLEQDGKGVVTGGRRVPPVPTRNVGGRPRPRYPRKALWEELVCFSGLSRKQTEGVI